MSTLETLIAARAVIAKRENWTQGSRHNSAGARCALGAIEAVAGWKQDGIWCGCANALAAALPAGPVFYDNMQVTPEAFPFKTNAFLVAGYNNSHSHAEVLELFDRAIAMQRTTDISIFKKILTDCPAGADVPA